MTTYHSHSQSPLARYFSPLTVFLMFFGCQLHAQAPGWTTPFNIKGETTYPSKAVSMAVSPSGKVYAVWETRDQPPSDMKARLYFATFNGQVWSPPVAITDTGSMDWEPDIALDTLGYPHVVWGEYRSAEIFYQYFDGTKWSAKQNVSETPHGLSFTARIAIDRTNTVHFVWHDNVYGDYQALYRSFNATSGWSPVAMVSDSAYNGGFPRLVTDSKNTVHITFTREVPPFGYYAVFYRKLNQGIWAPIERITFDDSLHSSDADIALDCNDRPVLVWTQLMRASGGFANGIRFDASNGADSAWLIPVVVKDTTESMVPSITFAKDKRAQIIWYFRDQATSYASILYSSGTGEESSWSAPVSLSVSSILKPFYPVVRADTTGMVHAMWGSEDHGIYYTRHSTVVGVHQEDKLLSPALASLLPNYPNPFNSTTVICYTLTRKALVSLTVFDVLGRVVAVLAHGEQPSGEHTVRFTADGLSSGIYFIRLQSLSHTTTREMLLVR